ncbi:MAG: cytochrome c oxidase subunit 2A [Thermomicrobium sp.]|nr:cytochrome c oxidase subunit 2A [Thermomicrobium sp.]
MSGTQRHRERPEEHPVGTLFVTLLILIVIVGIWLTVYFDMLGRG